jgi:methylphosphotriester-DNA--protein-cysteine methyltransferase
MKRSRHTANQIITKLRQAEADAAAGLDSAAICKKLVISTATYHRWRQQYGGLPPNQLRRLQQLEKQNAQLKKLVADQALDLSILQETVQGKD